MNLFVFGLGYSALHFVRRYRDRFASIAGTVTSSEKAEALKRQGIAAREFAPDRADPRIGDDLADAECLLICIPTDATGDPVLARFGDAVASAPRLRWIGYLSTVGVYGDHAGARVDETTPPLPNSARTKARLLAESVWRALGAETGIPVQIFRLAGIYGPGRSALDKLRAGTARRVVKPGQVFSRIHVEDIAAVLEASMARPRAGAVYNVADDEPAPPDQVIAHAAELLGMEPPPAVPFEEAELSPMARSFYGDSRRVSNALIKSELGVNLAYPTYREGLRALKALPL